MLSAPPKRGKPLRSRKENEPHSRANTRITPHTQDLSDNCPIFADSETSGFMALEMHTIRNNATTPVGFAPLIVVSTQCFWLLPSTTQRAVNGPLVCHLAKYFLRWRPPARFCVCSGPLHRLARPALGLGESHSLLAPRVHAVRRTSEHRREPQNLSRKRPQLSAQPINKPSGQPVGVRIRLPDQTKTK